MPKPRRLWTDYPPMHVALLKDVAKASLPALYGPRPKSEAMAFRQLFYRVRDALRLSLPEDRDEGSHAARLYARIENLTVKVVLSAEHPPLYDIIFDNDVVTSIMHERDPQSRQVDTLNRIHFAVAQRPPQISEPMFTDEEMEERIEELKKG
jgi:hypothetical protein